VNLTPNVSLEPPMVAEDDGGEGPAKHVHVGIYEVDGTGFQADMHMPGDVAPGFLAAAMLACCRGAAATHSPHLAAVLGDVLDSYGRAGTAKSSSAFTVAALDKLAAEHQAQRGHMPAKVKVPGWPDPQPFQLVRSILVAAGAWE
jgi:hypothetical protein